MYDVETTLKEVRQAISDVERQLSRLPSGALRVRHTKGTTRYYQREKGETDGKYLGKDSKDTIKALEEKAYFSELLKVAKKEEIDLKKLQVIMDNLPDYKTVFLGIPYEKRHLISPYEPIVNASDEIIRIFNKKKVDDSIMLITQNGEHVRSKSELIIADRLKAAGVPYFYEDPLIMAEQEHPQEIIECLYWHPDFRVQNTRTGRYYYWEHFGRLDSQDYCENCQGKLEIYAHYGYFPGENLIITTESSRHSLNLEYVDCLIDRYLK